MFEKIYDRIASFVGRTWVRLAPTAPYVRYNSFIPVHYANLKAFAPDVIYAHDLTALPVSAQVADELGSKLVFDAHELETHRNPPLKPSHKRQVASTERKYLPKCDYVTTVCESIENVLRKEYGLKHTGILLNSPRLTPAPSLPRWGGTAARLPLRLEAGLSPDDFALVYVGLVTVNRGIEFTLRAMMHTPDSIKLVVIGPARPGMTEKMQSYARSIGMENRLIMLPPVPPPIVYQYISGADASIIPVLPVTLSYEVALPNKFFEAGFAGLPLVCADLVELKKYTDKYQLGITYDAVDETDCTRAIMKVYQNPDAYRASKANLDAFKRDCSWESQEASMISMLNEIMNAGDRNESK